VLAGGKTIGRNGLVPYDGVWTTIQYQAKKDTRLGDAGSVNYIEPLGADTSAADVQRLDFLRHRLNSR